MDRVDTNIEQSIIDHEKRVTWTDELRTLSRRARQLRHEQRGTNEESRWIREGMIAILRMAESEQEVREMGLSDEVIRETHLAESLAEAWQRFGRAEVLFPR